MNRDAFEGIDARIICLSQCGSTNDEAKLLLRSGFSGRAVITADRQTAGRGRRGRTFCSPTGGVYMTLVLEGKAALDTTLLTASASVAVVRTLDALTDKRTMIKWVNDVLLGDKKVCGILCESVFADDNSTPLGVIAGIGVNLNSIVPDELRKIAASLECDNVTREQLAAGIAREFFALSEHPQSCLNEYRARSLALGKSVTFVRDGEPKTALATEIDDACGLVVRYPDGSLQTLRTGEVSVKLNL